MFRHSFKLPVRGSACIIPLTLKRIGSRVLPSCGQSRPLATVTTAAKISDHVTISKPGDNLHGFKLSKVQLFPIFDLTAYQLVHEKTGAQYLHLAKAGDTNKVFSISFRTNPPDDTGVPHILEHTTLCGSEKYVRILYLHEY
jgi:presequence protease